MGIYTKISVNRKKITIKITMLQELLANIKAPGNFSDNKEVSKYNNHFCYYNPSRRRKSNRVDSNNERDKT